jgi:hypothetical protein
MRLLVPSRSDVHELLGYAECADAMRDALAARTCGPAAPHGADAVSRPGRSCRLTGWTRRPAAG